jgi:hypothetical protein
MQPAKWPANVEYLTSYTFHSSVSQDARNFISTDKSYTKAPVMIKAITGPPTHPALGQFGLFAAKKIAAKTQIIDYIGKSPHPD